MEKEGGMNQSNKKPVPPLSVEVFTGETTPEEQAKKEALQSLVDACLINLSERLEPPPVAMQIIEYGKPITVATFTEESVKNSFAFFT